MAPKMPANAPFACYWTVYALRRARKAASPSPAANRESSNGSGTLVIPSKVSVPLVEPGADVELSLNGCVELRG